MSRIVSRERGIRQTNTGAWVAVEVVTTNPSVVPGRYPNERRTKLLAEGGAGAKGHRLAVRRAGSDQVIA